MTSTIRYKYNKLLIIIAFCLAMAMGEKAVAFPVETYASSSRLATGNWVKVSVESSGMYLITAADLRSWGFSDPAKVRIYGYGGQRISDVLSLANYIDDLPLVPSVTTSKGVVFYAQGVETWRKSGVRYVHTLNPFSTVGYYFITDSDSDESAPSIPVAGRASASEPATTFTHYLYHERDIVKLGETGHRIYGEDFKWTKSQTFSFDLTDIVADEPVTMTCSFVAKSLSSSSSLRFTANGTPLPNTSDDVIRASGSSGHSHGESCTTVKTFDVPDSRLQLGITFVGSSTVVAAHLDYIEINYKRKLRLSDGLLTFNLDGTQAHLSGASDKTRVWDVTNPLLIYQMNVAADADGVSWTNDYTGTRRYVAWNEGAAMPSPTYVGKVANQDLHAQQDYPDMVIFTLGEWASEAERIADLHRNSPDSLRVTVVRPETVYNEFASGVPDVNSFRRYLKMLWDRGNEAQKPLRYALFMGKPTFDNRGISDKGKAISYPTLPTWQSDTSLDDNVSYMTDDIFSFLRDNSGTNLGGEYLCIAVGRIPVRSLSDARTAVDKLYEYVNSSKRSNWRNQILLLADDENNGIHMEQSEDFVAGLSSAPDGDQFFVTKVYTDAFLAQNGTYPDARKRMYDRLDEGLMWWNYIGHANPMSWTGEGMLTYNDINNMYLRCYPMLYAATCEFLNWDSNSLSGAEIMYFTRQGGIIGAITAVRPVYISDNGLLGKALSAKVLQRDEKGNFLTIGEIYRQGKNNFLDSKGNIQSNSNKLRYVLMGDPAMRFATPANRMVLERINGEEVTPDAQVTVKARQSLLLEGYVADPLGNRLDDFTGAVTADLFDAEYSTTSHGYGEGKKVTFEEQGARLFSARDSIVGGRFAMRVAMPESVANNFRPAALNMYGTAADGRDAMGISRDLYVYGYDESAKPDTIAPEIETMYLNHPTFVSGGKVNSTPMLIATVSDNVGFNLSATGVGHTMTVQVDGAKTYTNVPQYFTPDFGSLSGTLAYPLEWLTDGNHRLRLRVWDTSGNMCERDIECFVEGGTPPTIYEVYTDANPASVEANFFISHNRPDAMMTVKIEVFNLLGHLVWSTESTGISDMFTSVPVNWNLTDRAGRRVGRGIYVYRATITESDGEQHVTKSNRIAVTGG